MIANKINFQEDYKLSNVHQTIEENSNFFDKLYRKYIKEIRLDFLEFWLENRDEILEYLEVYIEFEEDALEIIKRYLLRNTNDIFLRFVDFSDEFLGLLNHDYYFQQYFNWFKRYYLYFFKNVSDINFRDIDVKCLIEEDIEIPNESYIKIVITLPLESKYYKLMLKLMGMFIRKQEVLLNNLLLNYNHQKEIFKSFKKTFFIFNSIDEWFFLPFNPLEFIKLGKKICNDISYHEEARCRNMISRIYYGVLHFLVWEMNIINIDRDKFHKDAIDKINENDSAIGSFMLKMKTFRTTADYFLYKSVDMRTVERFMAIYEMIMSPYEVD